MTRRIRQQSKGRSGDVRPTTSRVLSALFSMFGPQGMHGLSVLDLYAGTGGFGLEALRRGASSVVMVEKNRRRCEELKLAASEMAEGEQARVICGDAIKALQQIAGPFDVVFADPPYADDPFGEIARELGSRGLLAQDGTVMLEHFHKTELPDDLDGLVIRTRRRYGDTAVSVYVPKTGTAGEGA